MLFIDSPQVTAADLEAIDPGVARLQQDEDIDLAAIIRIAWGTCAATLAQRIEPGGPNGWANLGYNASRWFPGVFFGVERLGLSQVVATSRQPGVVSQLLAWLRASALRDAYVAAVNRTTSERYQAKAEIHTAAAIEAWKALSRAGVPYVTSPLPRPGATFERDAGSFTAANVTQAGGSGGTPPLTLAVSYRAGEVESELGDPVTIAGINGATITASIAALIPPAGQVGVDRIKRHTATHWAIYLLTANGWRFVSAHPIAQTSATFTAASVTSTPHPGGQEPDGQFAFLATALRG